jgi:hypothetical protein
VLSRNQRILALATLTLTLGWLLAWLGFSLARHSRVTPESVRTYVAATDFAQLNAQARQAALRQLAAYLNALSPEDRRRARLESAWGSWFEAMTDDERAWFVEATLPTGIKQMLSAFEQLTEEKRQQAVEDALKRLKDAQEQSARDDTESPPAESPALNEELRQRMTRTGLAAFYSQSSARTKAELAPVLEELQRMMESGAMLRPRRHRE